MQEITAEELAKIKADCHILDIREEYEFELGNLGCANIPMASFCAKVKELPNDKTVVLVCKTGRRAEALANLLEIEYDRKNIAILQGGITAWKENVDNSISIA